MLCVNSSKDIITITEQRKGNDGHEKLSTRPPEINPNARNSPINAMLGLTMRPHKNNALPINNRQEGRDLGRHTPPPSAVDAVAADTQHGQPVAGPQLDEPEVAEDHGTTGVPRLHEH